jgi:hypothetical protein
LLLNDNTPAVCALNVKQLLASKAVCMIQHLPTRQIWHRRTLLLFPKSEVALKGECFSDFCDIQCGVTELLNGVSLPVFQRALEDDTSFVWIWVGAIMLKVFNKNF